MTHSLDQVGGHDPCLQIQVDLSAMVDGELDPAAVRRVMVHSDLCDHCRSFLDGIRNQARLHKEVATTMPELVGAAAGSASSSESTRLRDRLTANRSKLSRVLYELGRGFVLMGLSADFSREVAKEPVPVPDMAMRGRNLLDELSRQGPTAASPDWVAAKELFDGQLRSADDSLARGQRLLAECLALDESCHEARIYLGLVHYVHGQRGLARRQFQQVLASAMDRKTRGYALLNLSNVHLDEGDAEGAVQLLQQLVDSGAVADHPSLSTAYFNMGLAQGLSGRFTDCAMWFQRLAAELPHKRSWMAREVGRRSHFLHLIRSHPDAKVVSDAFPTWFAPRPAG